jgi:predicted XRE-type DNA-binding protein
MPKQLTQSKLLIRRGSGNVFADFNDSDASIKYLKVQAAGEIIDSINKNGLTVRAAALKADVDAADIQRIRNADLSKFTLDRLLRIAGHLGRQGQDVVFIRHGFGTIQGLTKKSLRETFKEASENKEKNNQKIKALPVRGRMIENKKITH